LRGHHARRREDPFMRKFIRLASRYRRLTLRASRFHYDIQPLEA
jgi:hypothetical protein